MAAGSLWASQQSSGLRVCEALYLDMGQLGGWQPGLRGPVSGHGAARGVAAGVKVIPLYSCHRRHPARILTR